MNSVSLTIKGEPASKANQRMIVKFGDRPASIKSPKARNYEQMAQMQIPDHCRVMFDKPVKVEMTIYYASNRPDLDESVILDVLQAKKKAGVLLRRGVYVNDRLVHEKHIKWGLDKNNPRAEIVVSLLEDPEPLLTTRYDPPQETGS